MSKLIWEKKGKNYAMNHMNGKYCEGTLHRTCVFLSLLLLSKVDLMKSVIYLFPPFYKTKIKKVDFLSSIYV